MAYQIMEDLFFIERGFLNGNHFVYRSQEPVLIDTGYVSDFAKTERLIADLGVNLSHVRLIINTHCHCDHIGGNRIIQAMSACDIALHKFGHHFVNTRDDWSTWWRYYDQAAEFFTCTRALEDGETITTGPHQFQVLYTPGHAADGIVLYNKKEKTLLSSDTLWEDDMAVVTVRVEGSRALFSFQKSLERLEGLDVRVVYPGHGRPFTDMKGAIQRSKRRVEGYLNSREKVATDVLKKIMIYTLLMKRAVGVEEFFPHLMSTIWFRETVDLCFDGQYGTKYDEIVGDFLQRGIVKCKGGKLFTTVKP